ncbi:hypothetical protein HK105_208359 [Polyrhizophydium stewartii]|uniref:Uncharacterized protein n=1 Tax=Polyrhizophydium stewartii TaxID=2732419 RepID=A0ABR4MY19_9FUNG
MLWAGDPHPPGADDDDDDDDEDDGHSNRERERNSSNGGGDMFAGGFDTQAPETTDSGMHGAARRPRAPAPSATPWSPAARIRSLQFFAHLKGSKSMPVLLHPLPRASDAADGTPAPVRPASAGAATSAPASAVPSHAAASPPHGSLSLRLRPQIQIQPPWVHPVRRPESSISTAPTTTTTATTTTAATATAAASTPRASKHDAKPRRRRHKKKQPHREPRFVNTYRRTSSGDWEFVQCDAEGNVRGVYRINNQHI